MYRPIVQELAGQIRFTPEWHIKFESAVAKAASQAPADMQGISTLGDFYRFMDALLTWAPFEGPGGREVYHRLCVLYFVFGQDDVYGLQSPTDPGEAGKELTWLSEWLVRYARAVGTFSDTPASLTPDTLATFWADSEYRMDHYPETCGGWRTLDQFFARNVKPGYRAIAKIEDAGTIVSPADSVYENQWLVNDDSCVDIKELTWPIRELLKDSEHSDELKGVGDKVLEARLIKGQVHLEVTVDEKGTLRPIECVRENTTTDGQEGRALSTPNTAGYQFCQMRGLVVLKTDIGLVAVLPIGMAQVSSVVPTAGKGKTLFKGEETFAQDR